MSATQTFLDELQSYVGKRYGVVYSWDCVNEPMIRQWCEALDFDFIPYTDTLKAASTAHRGIVAPAAMLPVWLMPGLRNQRPDGSDLSNNREIMPFLEQNGYVGILGTNCEQEYERPLRPGERISCTHMTESLSEEKQTKFGNGFFITFLQEFFDAQDQLVGTMRLRILRFKPQAQTKVEESVAKPLPAQPVLSPDTAFFWEGLKAGKLLIQRCQSCQVLQHPPVPACMSCHSLSTDFVESSGMGHLVSFVVIHKPQVVGFEYPHPVGLIELDEGVRLVAPIGGVSLDKLQIGMRVKAHMEPNADAYRLPSFYVVEGH